MKTIYTKEIDHFTVVCSVTWPLNGSEAEGDLVLIQTSLPLLCKSRCFNAKCIYTTKAERSVSKQGHLQPRCHSKARSLIDNCRMVYSTFSVFSPSWAFATRLEFYVGKFKGKLKRSRFKALINLFYLNCIKLLKLG